MQASSNQDSNTHYPLTTWVFAMEDESYQGSNSRPVIPLSGLRRWERHCPYHGGDRAWAVLTALLSDLWFSKIHYTPPSPERLKVLKFLTLM